MLVSIADMVEMVIVGLTFVSDLQSSIDIVIKKFFGYTVVVDGENQVVGETFTAENLLERCAKHGAVARSVAPSYLTLLQDSKSRVKIADRIVKLQKTVADAIAKLQKHDAKICSPYDLDSLFHWVVDVDSITVNDHTVIEESRSRRTTSQSSVQNKTLGSGRGHRALTWAIGTYPIVRGQFDGYTLCITQDTFTVSFGDTIVYTESYSDLANVPALAQSAYEVMYAQINDGATPGRRNLCKMWAMPTASADVE